MILLYYIILRYFVKISNKTSTQDLFSFEIFFFRLFPKSLINVRRPWLELYYLQKSDMFQDPLFLGIYIGKCDVSHVGSYLITYTFRTWVTIFISVTFGQDRIDLKSMNRPRTLEIKKCLWILVDTNILWYELVWDVSILIFILIGFCMMRISSNKMDIMWYGHEGIHQLLYQNKAFVGAL